MYMTSREIRIGGSLRRDSVAESAAIWRPPAYRDEKRCRNRPLAAATRTRRETLRAARSLAEGAPNPAAASGEVRRSILDRQADYSINGCRHQRPDGRCRRWPNLPNAPGDI